LQKFKHARGVQHGAYPVLEEAGVKFEPVRLKRYGLQRHLTPFRVMFAVVFAIALLLCAYLVLEEAGVKFEPVQLKKYVVQRHAM
jgi:hypothetical protein